eukprot:1507753-Rhodomonas_salina.2
MHRVGRTLLSCAVPGRSEFFLRWSVSRLRQHSFRTPVIGTGIGKESASCQLMQDCSGSLRIVEENSLRERDKRFPRRPWLSWRDVAIELGRR